MNIVIQKAIDIVGSQRELAQKVGVNQSAVSKWLCGGGIRSKYITALVIATNGTVTFEEILSSLEPNANDSEARL
ncbi:transcriptional regulator [Erwinia pyrifoliae]|uniref:transcriptional regulator n=1 Tax=Erwinia pyrifoliae TaxID=79967 RepID=UPI0001960F4F|nr:YdaS family helix-turn-helix protein [Erwinia pyrifoliae]AUX72460.1 transcriptional regulator [Erwinia pyrifoliae]MCA8877289.1 transcriptional regulator [Erwinia pyrifoliae]CAX55854.1 Lambda repressor-like protein [Erwinia pyrifoliae Ep1/96]